MPDHNPDLHYCYIGGPFHGMTYSESSPPTVVGKDGKILGHYTPAITTDHEVVRVWRSIDWSVAVNSLTT